MVGGEEKIQFSRIGGRAVWAAGGRVKIEFFFKNISGNRIVTPPPRRIHPRTDARDFLKKWKFIEMRF